ncbi:hypothetical protein GGI42DRAFT_59053 [Trichoderma sp. SZMC 28013]
MRDLFWLVYDTTWANDARAFYSLLECKIFFLHDYKQTNIAASLLLEFFILVLFLLRKRAVKYAVHDVHKVSLAWVWICEAAALLRGPTYSSMGDRVWTLFVFDRSWRFWLCHIFSSFLFSNFVIRGVYF